MIFARKFILSSHIKKEINTENYPTSLSVLEVHKPNQTAFGLADTQPAEGNACRQHSAFSPAASLRTVQNADS